MLQTVDALLSSGAGSNLMEISCSRWEPRKLSVSMCSRFARLAGHQKSPIYQKYADGGCGIRSVCGAMSSRWSPGAIDGISDAPGGLGGSMMVAEYNKRVLGFLVHAVDRITRVELAATCSRERHHRRLPSLYYLHCRIAGQQAGIDSRCGADSCQYFRRGVGS